MKDDVMKILAEEGSFAAVEFLSQQDDSLAATQTCASLLRHFYWEEKDLPLAVVFGRRWNPARAGKRPRDIGQRSVLRTASLREEVVLQSELVHLDRLG